MLRNRHYNLGILIILILVMCSCQSQGADQTPHTTQDSSGNYIQYSPVVFSTGRVVPIENMNLSFNLSGVVENIFVSEGDLVESGDVIATLDQSLLLSDLNRVEANLALAQARYDKLLSGTHPLLLREAEFQATSIASGPITSLPQATAQAADADAAQARLEYLMAQPLPEDIAIAEAELAQAEADVERARILVASAEMVAPVDGTILNVYIRANEYAFTGQSVIQLGDITNLAVETRLDDIEVAEISIGDTATMTFEALQGIAVTGNVINIKTDLDQVENNFVVLIALINPPSSIKSGMIGDIRIQTE